MVAGETRDSKGDPIKACSAQRLEIKEQNNTGNQTMLISYDPPYLGGMARGMASQRISLELL